VASIGYLEVRPDVTLRADPARPADVAVVHDKADLSHFEVGTPEFLREVLHGSVNAEVQSLEIAAQSLADFRAAGWATRLDLARQCWDETRHARLLLRQLRRMNGRLGEFPVMNREWAVVCAFDSLAARLAIQNRLFEGGSLDIMPESVETWRRVGDDDTAAVMDAVLADEISHVAFANRWLSRLAREDPRAMLQAVTAMDRVRTWNDALASTSHTERNAIEVNTEDRRRAGFSC
jgi:uncharacterized ferritin-like protein (DUF455 family)